ncbi:molybdenum cofactor synthesis domain-containing protein [Candidatus Methanocrinis natronophilus]|uniref:Molybdopterin-binding protein n=1 Tax=Candidatus Methanocrinis natronophilus TaxID=3033396 RepID=A0ABT5X720_9EURY|nr:gephyrin-like molybdotransferase Glp [Candidatus Methanocrinis natronophilus]MDF0590485.1 molybdopterin-binding protein [Candidatus Methanocrinis natronophilus]
MQKEFRALISLDEAKKIVLDAAPKAGEETVPLEEALGRVLAEKVASAADVPGFDRAAMDGFALRSADSLGAREDRPLPLALIGTVPMGRKTGLVVGDGEAAAVSTGSMIPEGADAVVMVEHTELLDETLLIRRPVRIGENLQGAGGDVGFGETVLLPGRVLSPREIGLLAAVGRKEVRVRHLRVAVASTGDELASPGEVLAPGQIYDINSYSIAAAVEDCGGTPRIYGILPDDHDRMADGLLSMAEESDLVLVSGSTSAGIGDMVYRVVEELGEVVFHGINLQPGKPTLFGFVDEKPFIGLPGYPTSALTVFGLLAAPAIRRALGTGHLNPSAAGRLARPVRSEGRRQMLAVAVVGGRVLPVDKGSGSITTLAAADGVIEIPERVELLDRGEVLEVQLFGNVPQAALLLEGEDCPRLEALVASLPFPVRFIPSGSRRGAASAEDGVADVAAVSRHHGEKPFWDEAALVPAAGYRRDLVIMAKDPDILNLEIDLERMEGIRVLGWSRESEMDRIFRRVLAESGHEAPRSALPSGRQRRRRV